MKIQKRQLSAFNTAAKSGSNNEESDDLEKEDVNRKHSYLTRHGGANIPRGHDMGCLNILTVGGRLVV